MSDKVNLYHYEPLSTLEHFSYIRNFLNQKIWLTRLDEFNDPFEATFNYKRANANEILNSKITFNKYLNQLNAEHTSIEEKQLEIELQQPEALTWLSGQIKPIDDFFSRYGAICLTNEPSNIPMWAHYANDHTGYCVEFEIDLNCIYNKYREIEKNKPDSTEYTKEEFKTDMDKIFSPEIDGSNQEILYFQQPKDDENKRFILSKVIYQKTRPVLSEIIMDSTVHSQNEYEIHKLMLKKSFGVKFEQWNYENEYRLTVNANSKECGLMDLRAYPLRVSGIIMGFKIGEKLENNAKKLLGLSENHADTHSKTKEWIKNFITEKHKGIKLYTAEVSKSNYGIEYKEIRD